MSKIKIFCRTFLVAVLELLFVMLVFEFLPLNNNEVSGVLIFVASAIVIFMGQKLLVTYLFSRHMERKSVASFITNIF